MKGRADGWVASGRAASFLSGEYFVSGGPLDKATAGRCKSSEELRVPVTVGGTVRGPVVRPEGKAVALALAQRCLAGGAGAISCAPRVG